MYKTIEFSTLERFLIIPIATLILLSAGLFIGFISCVFLSFLGIDWRWCISFSIYVFLVVSGSVIYALVNRYRASGIIEGAKLSENGRITVLKEAEQMHGY